MAKQPIQESPIHSEKIPLVKPYIGEAEINNVIDVLRSRILTNALGKGPKVTELEEKFCRYIHTKYAVATNSGTSALHIALESLGIVPGDEIITTPFSFIASANAALFLGAIPIFVDIDPLTYTIDPKKISDAITDKTKAIIAVHLFGCPAKIDELKEIASEHDLYLIEDAAQAHGAKYKGKPVGSLGDIGCFSFYATKNMIAGEGGMITTNNKDVAHECKLISAHGQTERYRHAVFGYNYRMTEISAAIALAQLDRLDDLNKKRRKNAKLLNETLQSLEDVSPPYIPKDVEHVYHIYAAKILESSKHNRDEVIHDLNDKGVQTAEIYPILLYKQPLYNDINDPGTYWGARCTKYPDYSKITCAIAETVSKQLIQLPVHPNLTSEELELIKKTLKDVFLG